ncbi:MAG: hypothetical protein Q9226_009415, partial [Calogaya cf. arnoldii]
KRFEAYVISFAMHQQTFVSDHLRLLRYLEKQRDKLTLRHGRTIAEVELTKPAHLEIVAAHLIGQEAKTPCKLCAQEGSKGKAKGFFAQCIRMPSTSEIDPLGGRCTNCAFKNGQCTFEDGMGTPGVGMEMDVSSAK